MESTHDAAECPICSRNDFADMEVLTRHIEDHLSDNVAKNGSSSDADVVIVDRNDYDYEQTADLHSAKKMNGPEADLSIQEQLLERKNRLGEKFRSAVSASPVYQFFNGTSTSSPKRPRMTEGFETDEELAERLAREEDDFALARAIQMSEEASIVIEDFAVDENAIVIVDSDSEAPSSNHMREPSSSDFLAPSSAMKQEVFQHPNADSGFSSNFDVIPRMEKILRADDRVESFMLSGDFAHFASVPEDYGWSCGYRNAQMLISSLVNIPAVRTQLHNKLGKAFVPSILFMQQLMQQAWNAGWDPQGNHEHRGKIIGSKNWLGPVDLYSMLMNLGIECKIVYFVHEKDMEGPHSALFEWVQQYFSSTTSPNIPPVYLQHAGHSRTIAGLELRRNKDRYYLIFDPSTKKERIRNTSLSDTRWMTDNFRRTYNGVSKRHYEVLFVTGRVLSSEEVDRMRILSQSGIRGEKKVS